MSAARIRVSLCLVLLTFVGVVPAGAQLEDPALGRDRNCLYGSVRPGCDNPEPAGALAEAPGASASGETGTAPGSDYEFSLVDSDRPPVVETPYLKLGADAAPWLPRFLDVLEGNRPPRYTPGTVALMTGDQGVQYLAVKWRERDSSTARRPLEFHKVVVGRNGGRRLEWLRSYHDYGELFAPSGQVLFQGEAPSAVVFLWSGGSGHWGLRLRILQMTRNTVDVTPDWAGKLVDVVDLDHDGQYEAVTQDWWRWETRLDSQWDPPELPVVLSRRDGRFVHDCRRFAGLLRRKARDLRHQARRGYPWPDMLSSYLSGTFLALVQGGAFDAARGLLPDLEAAAERRLSATPSFRFTARQVVEDHVAVLEWALAHPEAACPASAPGVPSGPNGVLVNTGKGYIDCNEEHPC